MHQIILVAHLDYCRQTSTDLNLALCTPTSNYINWTLAISKVVRRMPTKLLPWQRPISAVHQSVMLRLVVHKMLSCTDVLQHGPALHSRKNVAKPRSSNYLNVRFFLLRATKKSSNSDLIRTNSLLLKFHTDGSKCCLYSHMWCSQQMSDVSQPARTEQTAGQAQPSGCSGHVRFTLNHSSMQLLWYIHKQGSLAMVSPWRSSSRQIIHSSLSSTRTSSL